MAPGVEPSPESDFEFCSDQTFQVGVNHSQKESRCQTKRSMSPGAENRARCALLTLSVPPRPRRDAPSLLLSGFSMELEARMWFAAPQRRNLRAMKTDPALQTVNLLALRLQWFESTPAQASPRAILQVMAQLAPAGINIIIKPQEQTHLPAAMFHRTTFLFRGCSC